MKSIPVEMRTNVTREEFENDIMVKDAPVVVRGADFGTCLAKWTPEYLKEKLGPMLIKFHHSKEPTLNFIDKNFTYQTTDFGDFISRCTVDDPLEFLYLRSLGTDRRGREVANIREHFKPIADDIELPSFVPLNQNLVNNLDNEHQLFSSVFRISSPNLVLWTHYDILDNILVQVRGTKRVVLFSPEDIPFLYLEGDKSKVIDIDADQQIQEEFPLFMKARKFECLLRPGDALFIPSLWFHNVKSLDFSVSVNFFWKDKDISMQNLYDKTDVYGNKDLVIGANALSNLDKIIKNFEKLPKKFRKFYFLVMIEKLKNKVIEL